jgi:hypothetical protein
MDQGCQGVTVSVRTKSFLTLIQTFILHADTGTGLIKMFLRMAFLLFCTKIKSRLWLLEVKNKPLIIRSRFSRMSAESRPTLPTRGMIQYVIFSFLDHRTCSSVVCRQDKWRISPSGRGHIATLLVPRTLRAAA